MELQFLPNKIPCLRQIKGEAQTQEQTQELRLSDGMPDVGRVLCAWGQVMVRGKEWRGDDIGVNCGVMAWVLYAPEDGSQAQCVECWIPMSMKWDIPDTGIDGTIMCQGLLRSVDARTLSSRKLMVRATVCMTAQAYVPHEAVTYIPEQVPEDIQLHEKIYPICLAREAGEKAFMMDEELTLPSSAPAFEKLVRCSLQPEVTEQKVLGDKAVFRGKTALHILYRTPEGAMASWDFDIPFSQYTELQQEYGHQAQVQILPMVTSMETEPSEQGRFRLKAGLSGQYMVYDTQDVTVVEDAYSPDRTVSITVENVDLPSILERQGQRIRAEQTAPFGSSRVADVVFYPGCPRKQRKPDEMDMELPGIFQTLYYDTEGVLQSSATHWQGDLSIMLFEHAQIDIWCSASGKPQATAGEDSTVLRGDVLLDTVSSATEAMPMVTGLTVGDASPKDPARPSLILRKAGQDGLWEMAKKCGSTVAAIQEANHLQGEPDPDRMLLIPVL